MQGLEFKPRPPQKKIQGRRIHHFFICIVILLYMLIHLLHNIYSNDIV